MIPASVLAVIEQTVLRPRSKVILVDASQTPITITLPPPKIGVTYIIRKVDDSKHPVIVVNGCHRREIL